MKTPGDRADAVFFATVIPNPVSLGLGVSGGNFLKYGFFDPTDSLTFSVSTLEHEDARRRSKSLNLLERFLAYNTVPRSPYLCLHKSHH
jgi:hypothetical protein